MPNVIKNAQKIARLALPILRNNLVMPNLIRRDYEKEFQKCGDTILVRKPNVFEAKDFTDEITIQEINQKTVPLTLDKIADVSVDITSKELTLDDIDFVRDILEPAMIAIAEKINKEGLGLYKNVYKAVGTAGKTPSTIRDIAEGRKLLNNAKAPLANRYAVWDPDADMEFSIIEAIMHADKSGSTAALKEGSIGRVQGLENFMSQQVAVHKAGTFTAVSTPQVKTIAKPGAETIELKGGSGSETLVKGDLLKINQQEFVVTEDAKASTGNIVVKIYPAVKTQIEPETNVVFADKTAGGHVANMVFNKNAFAFVNRPLELPIDGRDAYVVEYDGLSLRVVMGYNQQTKKNTISIDILYGYAPLYPSLAGTILG